ncbi:MAG: hypothetical protein ACK56I_11540, partial [bacterium]
GGGVLQRATAARRATPPVATRRAGGADGCADADLPAAADGKRVGRDRDGARHQRRGRHAVARGGELPIIRSPRSSAAPQRGSVQHRVDQRRGSGSVHDGAAVFHAVHATGHRGDRSLLPVERAVPA